MIALQVVGMIVLVAFVCGIIIINVAKKDKK
jgi:hypothetical protein